MNTKPLPAKRSWWRCFTRHEPEGRHELLRCVECHRLVWRDGEEVKEERHRGHHFRQTTNGSLWEFVRIKLGLVR